ncbi:MFS general substrate transporter [Neolentinus lepideus HHB14362 ss-1]|uniref:MFS general substrate transporter n=1 Tax=Neolentinus lepideus HHB14362 ss-1 TaxID=1314782 RepID=A0A165RC35_9AGAM|nr:MFS general substrate transporter [Neolentinus lepideus HHB14362 ss-1]
MSSSSDSVSDRATKNKDKAAVLVEEKEAESGVKKDDDDDTRLLSLEERAAAEVRIKRILDWRLMPAIILIFLLNYIDRVAVTAARLKGLEQDLHLTDVEYETILAILYASYCPAQIPGNMIINKVSRPSLFIGSCVVLWGLTSLLTGVTRNFAGILLCRVFIGLPEAAFYPGAMYLLSCWYTKKELSFRGAILYAGLLISNAFGSLIAAGILGNMEGVLGIRAWRWLFYIEGAITICIGFFAMWSLPDYPHNTRWINKAQRRLAQVRLAEDAGEADEDTAGESVWDGIRLAFLDPKVYIFALMACSQLLALSYVNFFPTLTATLGFGTTASLLLCAPPWIWSTIACCVNAWHCDRTGERFFHLGVWWWGVMAGYIIGLCTMNTGARYFSLFLMASGYAGFALTAVWVSNTITRPPAKRSVAIGIVNGFGNMGNLIGSFIWKENWGPKYHQSMIIGIASMALATACSILLRTMLKRENKRLDAQELAEITEAERERIEDAAKLEGITFEEALERKKGFRYLY